jgi:hypothetical protein
MAISEAFSGSETVSTTEWSLTTDTAGPDVDTTDGIYQAFLTLHSVRDGLESRHGYRVNFARSL